MKTVKKLITFAKAKFNIDLCLTVRGDRNFTFSYDGNNKDINSLFGQFSQDLKVTIQYDEECDFTCIYLDN